MLRKILSLTILTALILSVNTVASQQSDDEPIIIKWEMLTNVEWVWDNEFYQAKFSEETQKLDGKEVILEGFMFPLEYTRRHTNFLISSSPMSDCFFCGPGEAESMVFVKSLDEVEYLYTPFKMKGTFKLVTDASLGIIYELEDARLVR